MRPTLQDRDLPGIFCTAANITYEALEFANARERLLQYQMAHPTDTHSTILECMTSLDFPVNDINNEMLAVAETPLSNYFRSHLTAIVVKH